MQLLAERLHPRGPGRGIALIAVLWIVAGLSIAVTGIVHTLRSETRAIAAERRMTEMQAAGEAAIMLVLQDMTATRAVSPPPWKRTEVPFGGHAIVVEASALNGLIDLNRASPELLQALFTVAGGLGAQSSRELAQATVQARERPDPAGRAEGFEAVEDLMRVPGLGYDLYARLRPLVTADVRGAGRVNPQAAPREVLAVLAQGNISRVAAMVSARADSGTPVDTTALSGEFIDTSIGSRYRFQALVSLPDGVEGVVVRDVDLMADQRAGLPWRVFSGETRMRAISAKDV